MKDFDDKDLVITCVFLLCVGAMAIPNVSPETIVFLEKAMYGFFGLAVGKAVASKPV